MTKVAAVRGTGLPVCHKCGARGTFPAETDGSDMAEYDRYHTLGGYAYCERCVGGADVHVSDPNGQVCLSFAVPS